MCRMLLGSHPRICAPSETPWLFGPYGDGVSLQALLRVLCASSYGPVESIPGVTTEDIHRAANKFVLDIFRAKMKAEGKDILVLKTPDDINSIEDILKIFRQSLVVHIRRDVRDVALSTARTDWTNLNFFGDNNFANCVRRWVAWERKVALAKERSPDRIVSIRYEDLVKNPTPVLRSVVEKLGLGFAPEMLDYWTRADDAPKWDTGSRDAAKFRKIDPARAFAYRGHVPTAEEARAIADHERDIVALGYMPGWGEEAVSGPS